jgi:hypothetical protein
MARSIGRPPILSALIEGETGTLFQSKKERLRKPSFIVDQNNRNSFSASKTLLVYRRIAEQVTDQNCHEIEK